jgi:hypothetical protein
MVRTQEINGELFVQVELGGLLRSPTGMGFSWKTFSTSVKAATCKTWQIAGPISVAGNKMCIMGTQGANGQDSAGVIILRFDGQASCESMAEATTGWIFILMMEAGCGSTTGIPLTTMAVMDGGAERPDPIFTLHGAGSESNILNGGVMQAYSSDTGVQTLGTDGKWSGQEV